MSAYSPVDCDTHSRYEEAVLMRRPLRLKWRTQAGTIRQARITPLDVVTANGEEFFVVRDPSSEDLRVRLDHILSAETLSGEVS